MALKTITVERQRLADIAYTQLLEAIRSGVITEDEQLVQEKLAEQLQISRTPVREALLRLEQDGIVVSSSKGGFSLYRMSREEVRELYQARAAIEGQAVRILASLNDAEKNAQLRQVIESGDAIEDFYLQWFADGIEKTDLFNLDLDTSAHTPEECVQRIVAYMAAQPIRTPTPPPEMERRQFDG